MGFRGPWSWGAGTSSLGEAEEPREERNERRRLVSGETLASGRGEA